MDSFSRVDLSDLFFKSVCLDFVSMYNNVIMRKLVTFLSQSFYMDGSGMVIGMS